jgi:hypothetical protein
LEATETTEAKRDVDSIAAFAEAKPEDMKEKDPPKGKKGKKSKEPTPPTAEEITSAVAGVVLAEMKHWPDEVLTLIGDQHPNKESFIKGVPYVIGAYMHLARRTLELRRANRKREAEIKTAKLLGPVATELQELQRQRKEAMEQAVKDLEAERKKRLQEAKEEINREYNAKISAVTGEQPSEQIQKLSGRETLIKEAFEGACGKIDIEAKGLLEQVQAIEDVKDDWNSESRKARRLSKKEDAQPAQKSVE